MAYSNEKTDTMNQYSPDDWEVFEQLMLAFKDDESNIPPIFEEYLESIPENQLLSFLLKSLKYSVKQDEENRTLANLVLNTIKSLGHLKNPDNLEQQELFASLLLYKEWLLKHSPQKHEYETYNFVLTQHYTSLFYEKLHAKFSKNILESSNEIYLLFRDFISLPQSHFFSLTGYLNYIQQVLTEFISKNRKNDSAISWITELTKKQFSGLLTAYIDRPPFLNPIIFNYFKILISLYHSLLTGEAFKIDENNFKHFNVNFFSVYMQALWNKKNNIPNELTFNAINPAQTLPFCEAFNALVNDIENHSADSKTTLIDMAIRVLPFHAFNTHPEFSTVLEIMEPGAHCLTKDVLTSDLTLPVHSYVTDEETAFFCSTNNLHGFQPIKRDGNCFFRSVLKALDDDEETHLDLRAEAINYLLLNSEEYSVYFDEEEDGFIKYVEEMATDRTWAENIVLNIVAEIKECTITILDLKKVHGELILHPYTIIPVKNPSKTEITITRVNDNHYHAIQLPKLENQLVGGNSISQNSNSVSQPALHAKSKDIIFKEKIIDDLKKVADEQTQDDKLPEALGFN